MKLMQNVNMYIQVIECMDARRKFSMGDQTKGVFKGGVQGVQTPPPKKKKKSDFLGKVKEKR